MTTLLTAVVTMPTVFTTRAVLHRERNRKRCARGVHHACFAELERRRNTRERERESPRRAESLHEQDPAHYLDTGLVTTD